MANTDTDSMQHKARPDNAHVYRVQDTYNITGQVFSLNGSSASDPHVATYASSYPAAAAATITKRARLEQLPNVFEPTKTLQTVKSRKMYEASESSELVEAANVNDEHGGEDGEEVENEEEGEDEGDDGFVWIFNSIAEVKLKEFDRAQLSRNTAAMDDVNQYANSNRMQRILVKQIVAALSGGYLETPVGGEKYTKVERLTEWKRYQMAHHNTVKETLEKPKGPEQAQKCAWLIVEALLEAHQLGVHKVKNSGCDTSLIFSARANLCIKVLTEMTMLRENVLKGSNIHAVVSSPEGSKKLKIQNLWVNYGRKLAKETKGGKSARKSSGKRGKEVAVSNEAGSQEIRDVGAEQSDDEADVGEGNEARGASAMAGDESEAEHNRAEQDGGEDSQGVVAVQPDLSAVKRQKRKRTSN